MTETTAEAPGLPMWPITKAAYAAVFGGLKQVYLLAWKPFLVAVVIGFIAGFADGFVGSITGHPEKTFTSTLGVLGGFWSNAWFALAFHRYQLQGWNAETAKVRFRLGRAEGGFLATATALYVIYTYLPMAVALSTAPWAFPLWGVVAFLGLPLMTILALVFPALAAGAVHPLAQGWALGVGSWWAIFGVMFACGIPAQIFNMATAPFMNAPLAAFIIGLLGYPLIAIPIAGLCGIYKFKLTTAP